MPGRSEMQRIVWRGVARDIVVPEGNNESRIRAMPDFASLSTPMLKLAIHFRGWWMVANDFRNYDTAEDAYARRHNARYMPKTDCPDLPAMQAEYARRVRLACGG